MSKGSMLLSSKSQSGRFILWFIAWLIVSPGIIGSLRNTVSRIGIKVFQNSLKRFKKYREQGYQYLPQLSLMLVLTSILTLQLPHTAEAGQSFKHGIVMSRAVVLNE